MALILVLPNCAPNSLKVFTMLFPYLKRDGPFLFKVSCHISDSVNIVHLHHKTVKIVEKFQVLDTLEKRTILNSG